METCTILCCIGYGIAALWDEKERQVPRICSYCVCAGALTAFFIQWNKEKVYWDSVVISLGFFCMICICCKKRLLGKADVYMIFSMLLLLCTLEEGWNLLLGETLFFLLAFASAGIRLFFLRKKDSCPLVFHLFLAFLCSRLLLL